MLIADLHIHSKYSRATSHDCEPEMLDLWARRKGIGLVGTGDFTHPAWRAELLDKLQPAEDGLYTLRESLCLADKTAGKYDAPRFVVTGEISSIYCEGTRNIEVWTRNIKLTTLDKGRQRLILARRKRDK